MQINFNKILFTLDKVAFKQDEKELTLKKVCVHSLLSDESVHEDGESKMKRWKLASRIHDSIDEIEVGAEEIALIKKKMAQVYSTGVVGAAYTLLEGCEKA
jgi:hypothetical protein